jgi:FKBP-type peptidyl-prolyl cis-trans isomerase FkpA
MRLRLALAALFPLMLAGCNSDDTTSTQTAVPIENTTFAPSLGVNLAGSTKTASGLYIRDVTVGTGATLANGQMVEMYYAGYLANGTLFDSKTSGTGIMFRLGSGAVIRGWDEGLVGMKVGGTRQLVIPPSLGYGATGSGPIPGNAVLVFNVTARSVQ